MVPINWHLAGPEIAYILSDSEAKVFFGSNENQDISKACKIAAAQANFSQSHSISLGLLDSFTDFKEFIKNQSSLSC